MRALLVDDDPLVHTVTKKYSSDLPFLKVDCVDTPFEAVNLLGNREHDFLILDINLPELSGFELLENLNNKLPTLVVSSDESNALKSYDFNVVDFLLKPIERKKFNRAVLRVRELLSNQDHAHNSKYIYVKKNEYYTALNVDDITIVESDSDYLNIHTDDGSVSVVVKSMKSFIEDVENHGIIRVHRSHAVNLNKIRQYHERDSMVRVADKDIPVSKSYRNKLKEHLKII
jgi:DNA-binding LytR/AlgR family response regulator